MSIFTPYQRKIGALELGRLFGDARIARRYSALYDQMCSSQTSVIHRMSKTEADEQGYYRLLSNDRFSLEDLLKDISRKTSERSSVNHVLAIGDTTECNFDSQKGRFFDLDELGYMSDDRSRGLHTHVMIGLDADRFWGLGLCDVQQWARPKSTGERNSDMRRKLPINEKESYKWHLGVSATEEVLSSVEQITYVFDREADNISLFQHIEAFQSDFVIRLQHDRRLAEPNLLMSQCLASLDVSGTQKIKIQGRKARKSGPRRIKARKARQALIDIRYTQVSLVQSQRSYYIVDALERQETTPEGEEPIHWRLLTTHPVESVADALTIITYYAARWMIEQLFRIIKTQGFEIETTQLKKGKALRKIIPLTLAAGFEVLQLTMAKNHDLQMPIELLFSKKQIAYLSVISKSLEGKTIKQQNPYQLHQLAFATWVCARLGGWKGYQSKKPPGPIRILRGLKIVNQYMNAFEMNINNTDKDVMEP